jgi:hypothetical protein
MSLIVGCGGVDGVALAADSCTAINLGVAFPAEKLAVIPGHRLVVGFSGDVGAAQYAQAALCGPPALPDGVDALRREIGARLERVVPSRVGKVACLVGGVVGGRPALIEFDGGKDVAYDHFGSFAAVGSPTDWIAHIVGAPFRACVRELRHNTLLAYRLVEDAVAFGMYAKGPIGMYTVGLTDPAPYRLTPAELAALAQRTAAWRLAEQDLFARITAARALEGAAVGVDGRS